MNSVKPWGIGIFDTEEAVVIRAIFNRFVSQGHQPAESADHTVETFFHALEAESETGDMWVALAALLFDAGVAKHHLYGSLLTIDPEVNAARWEGSENGERSDILLSLVARVELRATL